MSCNYNCTELPEHEQVDCGEYPVGGIDALAILECDHTITDFTSVSEWNTNIASGKVTLIKGIKAEVPDASPVEGDNPVGGGTDTILDTFDRSITWSDSNVTDDNLTFYNALNRRISGIVYREINEGRITVIDEKLNFIGFRNVPASKKTKQMIKATAKWTAFDEPAIYTEPAGIFD